MRSEKVIEEGRLYTQEEDDKQVKQWHRIKDCVDRNCYNCFAADFDFLSCKKRKFQI